MTIFRPARHDDLVAIVELLANDVLGSTRERLEEPLPSSYCVAFETIENDPNNMLIVAQQLSSVVGVLQLTLIPGMTYEGGWRAQIEGVRVSPKIRGQGVGRALVEHAIERARKVGCRLVQLTTDKQRPEAVEFYGSIGFSATHEGMKLWLSGAQGH